MSSAPSRNAIQDAEPKEKSDNLQEVDVDVLEPAIQKIVRHEVHRREMHSGPMPSASQLEKYEKVLPGTALVIRDEFQANGRHLRETQMMALKFQKDDNDQNRAAANRLVWGCLAGALICTLAGHWQVGIAFIASGAVAVISGFLIGERPEAPKKDEESSGKEKNERE